MMTRRGHTVIHYGHELSELECTEHVNVLSDVDFQATYGKSDWKHKTFVFDVEKDEAYKLFTKNAIAEIGKRKKKNDFLLAFWGAPMKRICDAHSDLIVVEPGIGYANDTNFARWKIWESYALYHAHCGLGSVRRCKQDNYSVVIPNYFDPEDFVYKDQKEDYYLFIGRVYTGKGVHIAIDAAKRAGVKLIIAGQLNGDYKLPPLPDNVSYVGYADVDMRKTLMANAKAVLIPSQYLEPFGGVQIESLFSGTPIITSDWGAFAECNLHNVTGYRCRTMGDYVEAIHCIEQGRIKSQVCRQWAENYSLEAVAPKYEKYFNDVLDVYTGEGWYAKSHGIASMELKLPARQEIPKKLHMIWVGSEAPEYVGKNFAKWKELMPDWECRLWTSSDLHEGNRDIFPLSFIESCRIPAQQADIMRYFIIKNFGGVYVDADITPHRSLTPIVQNQSFVACHDLPLTWGYIAIGFFAATPNHFLMQEICARVVNATLNTDDVHLHTGPKLFGSVVFNYPNDYLLLPIESFYRNLKGNTLSNGQLRLDDVEERYGNHFYAATWVSKKVLKTIQQRTIRLDSLAYYFLTTDTNGKRKNHMVNTFGHLNLTEINPIMEIPREQSGATGFSRMLDAGLRNQDHTIPFQPFVLFEDDVSKYREFPEYLSIPEDCDILYIGLSLCGLKNDQEWWQSKLWTEVVKDNNEVLRIHNMLSSHGIIVCSPSGALALQKAVLEGYFSQITWDVFMAAIQPFYNVYALKEPLVYQDISLGGVESKTRVSFFLGENHEELINERIPSEEILPCVSNKTETRMLPYLSSK